MIEKIEGIVFPITVVVFATDKIVSQLDKRSSAANDDAGTSATSFGSGTGSGRFEKALAALADRQEEAARPVIAFGELLEDSLRPIDAIIDDVVDILNELRPIEVKITELLGAVEDLGNAAGPFRAALETLAAPFEAIFDFLADPPSVPFFVPQPNPLKPGFPGRFTNVDLFPAISRSDIDKIIDFFESISGAILGVFDPVLSPILTPIRNAFSSVLDKLNPISDFAPDIRDLALQLDALIDALPDLNNLVERLEKIVEEFEPDQLLVPEITPPRAGAPISTYFGGGKDETVVGAEPGDDEAGDWLGAMLFGGGGDDHLIGTRKEDFLMGGRHADLLEGFDGADVLLGGSGDDLMRGGRRQGCRRRRQGRRSHRW